MPRISDLPIPNASLEATRHPNESTLSWRASRALVWEEIREEMTAIAQSLSFDLEDIGVVRDLESPMILKPTIPEQNTFKNFIRRLESTE
jgi:hypothetical protein